MVALAFASVASAATAGWSRLPLRAGGPVMPYEVSCASADACFALGETGSEPFVRDAGTHVTRLAGPRGGRSSSLTALSCASTTDCFAIGFINRNANHGLLALRWSSGRWSRTSLPAGPGRSLKQGHYQLTGLSCPSAGMCVAVGQVQGVTAQGRAVTRPLLLAWNGRHWSSARSPLSAGTLRSVSCASASACTAVGAGTRASVVLRLRTGHWMRVRLSPLDSREVGSSLSSISCPTATSCLAGGLIDTTPHAALPVTRVVTLRESGGGWSVEVPPVPALVAGDHAHHLADALTAVSCGAPGSCLGVGTAMNDDGNGAQASLSVAFTPAAPHPIAQTHAGALVSVSCPTAAFCLIGGNRSITRSRP